MNYLYHVHNAVLHAVDSEHHQSSRRVFTYVRVVLNSFTRKRTSSLKKNFRQTFAISIFNFSGTSGEYGTGARTNEPP